MPKLLLLSDDIKEIVSYFCRTLPENTMANQWFKFKQFTIWHDKCGMKVGTDGVLLGAWATVNPSMTILDVGTGTGLIALMLAQRGGLSIDAIDIDQDAFCQAQENICHSPFANRIKSYHSSLEDFLSIANKKYDLIISNPPYFDDSLKSSDLKRNRARHTDTLSLHAFIRDSLKLLTPGGLISMIIPAQKEDELNKSLTDYGLYPIRKTYVIPVMGASPKRLLIELSLQMPEVFQENTLTIETTRHVYTDEYKELTQRFYLNM